MKNVKFSYLYRDGSNYKKWGEIVFSNREEVAIEEIDSRLRQSFESEEFFVAHQIQIPEVFLYADGKVTEYDHCFHAFSAIELTDDPPNDKRQRSISSFVQQVESESRRGWICLQSL